MNLLTGTVQLVCVGSIPHSFKVCGTLLLSNTARRYPTTGVAEVYHPKVTILQPVITGQAMGSVAGFD